MRLIDAEQINFNDAFIGQSDFARDTRSYVRCRGCRTSRRINQRGGDASGQGDSDPVYRCLRVNQRDGKGYQRLRQRRKVILQDSVKGSMQEFPYAAQSYHIEGLAYATVQTPGLLDDEEELWRSEGRLQRRLRYRSRRG